MHSPLPFQMTRNIYHNDWRINDWRSFLPDDHGRRRAPALPATEKISDRRVSAWMCPAILSSGKRIRHMVPWSDGRAAPSRESGIRAPRANGASRNGGPHLFGVCCIIRSGELATRESLLSIFFFSPSSPS